MPLKFYAIQKKKLKKWPTNIYPLLEMQFIGLEIDYYVCLEGALKLKEISYIQAEGFAGGEFKHGTIALIEEGTPIIALAAQESVNLSIRGNVKEVVARGANPCIISMKGVEMDGDSFVIPEVHELLTPLVSVIPLQFRPIMQLYTVT